MSTTLLDHPAFKVDREAPYSILTWTGRAIDPWTVDDPRLIDIKDIARSLSMICRFVGHIPSFYSVAEHSTRGVEMLRSDGFGRDVQRSFLLHDATEAYVQDLPAPLKHRPELSEYREAEDRLHRVIGQKFGYDPFDGNKGIVKEYDKRMYVWEVLNVRTGKARGLVPAQAEDQYLLYAKRLGLL